MVGEDVEMPIQDLVDRNVFAVSDAGGGETSADEDGSPNVWHRRDGRWKIEEMGWRKEEERKKRGRGQRLEGRGGEGKGGRVNAVQTGRKPGTVTIDHYC